MKTFKTKAEWRGAVKDARYVLDGCIRSFKGNPSPKNYSYLEDAMGSYQNVVKNACVEGEKE